MTNVFKLNLNPARYSYKNINTRTKGTTVAPLKTIGEYVQFRCTFVSLL